MGAVLRGVSVRIEDGFYYFGSRKYVREACPLNLRTEIEKAVAAANSGTSNNRTNKRAKHSTASTGGNYGLSATGRQPRQRKN